MICHNLTRKMRQCPPISISWLQQGSPLLQVSLASMHLFEFKYVGFLGYPANTYCSPIKKSKKIPPKSKQQTTLDFDSGLTQNKFPSQKGLPKPSHVPPSVQVMSMNNAKFSVKISWCFPSPSLAGSLLSWLLYNSPQLQVVAAFSLRDSKS